MTCDNDAATRGTPIPIRDTSKTDYDPHIGRTRQTRV
jgi:hypothetical protein